jgi:hypothetical protein
MPRSPGGDFSRDEVLPTALRPPGSVAPAINPTKSHLAPFEVLSGYALVC